MPTATVNGVRLFYALSGDGPPLVLIHGSWGDHVSWDLVVPALAQRFRVLTYDRRGHSQSQRPSTQGSTEEDVDDLVALIEHLGLAPAHVAGTSSGASLALRLAARHPELVRSVAAHEPGLFGLFVDDPNQGTLMREALGRLEAAATRLAAGDVEGGTRQFMETVVFGPRAWEIIPPERRQVLMSNAPTVRTRCATPAPGLPILPRWRRFPVRSSSRTVARASLSGSTSSLSSPLSYRTPRCKSLLGPGTMRM